MYLSRFGVKRYKCLGDIDIPLTPIHVLIGQNDAGKTSLLEAIDALHKTARMPLPEVFPGPWHGRELVHHGSPEPSVEFCGEWTASSGEQLPAGDSRLAYGVPVEFPQHDRSCTTDGDWIEKQGQRRDLWPSHGGQPSTTLLFVNRDQAIPGANMKELEAIARLVKPAHSYAFDARVMALPAAIDLDRKFRLDRDGFGLATLLGDLIDYDAERFIHLRREFCGFFPQFKSVRVEMVNAHTRELRRNGTHEWKGGIGREVYFVTQSGHRLRAQQASDGVTLFLGFLALAHLPEPPNLLLIEEPENGVYPKRLGEVITLLRQLTDRTEGVRFPQIILSTHSPYVLSFFQPEEVTFLSRPPDDPDGPVRARPLRDAPNIKERMADGEFYLGELWYNLSEEELFGEP